MDVALNALMDRFFRTYTESFSAEEFALLITRLGLKISASEAAEYLEAEPRIFPLENDLYLTRAGAFTGKFFSFAPTAEEINQGLFIAGDRCVPFVDSEIVSCHLRFEYNGRRLPKKIFNTSSITARDLFTFYGDEYVSQYVASDPASKEFNIAKKDFELPSKLKLTGFDLSQIIEDCDFKHGDRLLCRVTDWDNCVIEVFPHVIHKMNPFMVNSEDVDRQKWLSNLEKYLMESFDSMGPCPSIEEQLANVFYEHSNTLCVPECGSIHEMLDTTRKIGMEMFGVESRLWFKGQDVPAIGKWNEDDYQGNGGLELEKFDLPEYVIDCFLKDQMYEKRDDVEEVINKMIPGSVDVTPEARKSFSLQIKNRNVILRRKYNWFADFAIGSIRHRALELYSKVGSLVYEIDSTGNKLNKYPQQELVILSQLFAHIMRMLETLSGSHECQEEEATAMSLSLEGMEYNFEDIRVQLISTVNKLHAEDFEVI